MLSLVVNRPLLICVRNIHPLRISCKARLQEELFGLQKPQESSFSKMMEFPRHPRKAPAFINSCCSRLTSKFLGEIPFLIESAAAVPMA